MTIRTPLAALILCSIVTASSVSHAARTGILTSARVGYGLPFGNVQGRSGDHHLGDVVTGQLPVGIEAGWVTTDRVFLGAYFEWGPAFVNADKAFATDACSGPGASCTANDLRVGLEATYRFLLSRKLSAWAGLGAGYESMTARNQNPMGGSELTAKGLDLSVQLGADYTFERSVALGPYLSVGAGQYRWYDASTSGSLSATPTSTGGIGGNGLHGWVELGVRGTFGPW